MNVSKINKGGYKMDVKRAQEIVSSPDMINVYFNAIPVYIENINDKNGIAYIHHLDKPDKTEEVSIKSLVEN